MSTIVTKEIRSNKILTKKQYKTHIKTIDENVIIKSLGVKMYKDKGLGIAHIKRTILNVCPICERQMLEKLYKNHIKYCK
jgi:hypothetical protein